MKITPQQTNAWLQNIPASIRAVLLYGPNRGLVQMHSESLAKRWLGSGAAMFNFEQRSYSSASQDPAILASLVQLVPLGGGNICIRLTEASVNAPSPLQEILTSIPVGVLVIIEAGELPPSSSLRKCAEQSESIAAIACYYEEGAARQRHIVTLLAEQGIQCDSAALGMLVDVLPEDQLAMQRELDKLITYLGSKRSCSMEDVERACCPTQAASLDHCAFAFLKQHPGDALNAMQLVFVEGHSSITLLRHLARKLLLLHELQTKIHDGGESEDKAIAGARPPIFFRQQPQIKLALRQWDRTKIGQTLLAIQRLEHDCKYLGTPATQQCLHWLMHH
jgi:DNA polymerase-3 subunit delta